MRRWIAINAIWLLLVQAALGGFLAARVAAAPALPLCATGTAADTGDGSADPANLPECCRADCTTPATATPPPPPASVVALEAYLLPARVVADLASRRGESWRAAHGARAPPL